MEEWLKDFDEAHDTILPHLEKEQPYIMDETYEKAVEGYKKLKEKIENDHAVFTALKKPKASTSKNDEKTDENDKEEENNETQYNGDYAKSFFDDSDEEELTNEDPKVKLLQFLWTELKIILEQTKKPCESLSSGVATAKLKNIEQTWNEFRTTFREVALTLDNEWVKSIHFGQLQADYIEVCGKLNDFINNNKQKSQSNALLPKIKLPEFDGKSSNWRAFKDLYDRIVHYDASLSNAVKIQYLKSNLKGEAAKLVAHISPTDANYETCYQILCSRL